MIYILQLQGSTFCQLSSSQRFVINADLLECKINGVLVNSPSPQFRNQGGATEPFALMLSSDDSLRERHIVKESDPLQPIELGVHDARLQLA